MADVKFLREWTDSLKAELDEMDATDFNFKVKNDLYASLLAKAASAIGAATIKGASSSNGDLTRDQIAALRSAETALNQLEFCGRDYDLTAKFVATVDKIHDTYIEDDIALAGNFTKQVKMRFSENPYARLRAETSQPATWTLLKDWINSTYDCGLTSIQLLSRAIETDYKRGSCWKAFATSVDSRMLAAEKAVLAQIRKRKHELNATSNFNDDCNAPAVTDVFAFFSASICADRLKNNAKHIHALMAQEWKSINNAADLACKAEFLLAQTGRSSDVYYGHQSKSGHSKSPKDKSPEQKKGKNWRDPCKWGNDCRKIDTCKFYHGPGLSKKSSAFVAQRPKSGNDELPVENSTVFA
jgi:hypothetical protein